MHIVVPKYSAVQMKLFYVSHVTLKFMKLINFSRSITEWPYKKMQPQASTFTASGAPLCDICQERKWYFLCLEDRALLCNDCDGAIHTCNSHQRFLLSGVQVSDQSLTENSGCSMSFSSETYQVHSKASLNSQYSSAETEAGNSGDETDKNPSVILSP